MHRISTIASIVVCVSAPAFGQGVHGEIQTMPYDALQQHAENLLDFEPTAGQASPEIEWVSEPIEYGSVSLSTAFQGQYVNSNITGFVVPSPLRLTIGGFIVDGVSMAPSIETPRNGQNHLAQLSDVNRTEHSLVKLNFPRGNTAISTLIDYAGTVDHTENVQIDSEHAYFGLYPVSIIFSEDQTALGFNIIRLNAVKQIPNVVRSAYSEPRVRVKFFRRNGELISEIIITPDHNKKVAFARCGSVADIAGIQITNSTRSGLAFDDFLFGVPAPESATPIPLENSDLLTNSDEEIQQNPLQVDLCSYYTS